MQRTIHRDLDLLQRALQLNKQKENNEGEEEKNYAFAKRKLMLYCARC